MKRYSKKCQKSRGATEEEEQVRLRRSLYCVLGNEYICRPPKNAFMSPAEPGRRRRLRSPDLEFERFETEISTSIGAVNFSREEASSSSSVENNCGDSRPSLGPKTPAVAPSAAELEEFFTEAEEYVQKRFAEKYNYDIMKDAPISEGRYQWVPTHI